MVSRREKLKKTHLETFEQSTLTMGALLLDPIVPVSVRRADKLLDSWDSIIKEMLLLDSKHSASKNNVSLPDNLWINSNVFNDGLIAKESNILPMKKQSNCYRLQSKTVSNEQHQIKTSELYDLKNSYHHYSLNNSNHSMHLPLPPSLSYHSPSNYIYFINIIINFNLAEQQRREELYVFRSSNSPLPPIEIKKNFDTSNFNNSIESDGNISDASNFTEYSVAWSNSSTSNGALFDIENEISPVRLKNEKITKPLSIKIKEPISINPNLKLKKINVKTTKRKLSFNELKNSSSKGAGYVLHHPELALTNKRISRSTTNVPKRIV